LDRVLAVLGPLMEPVRHPGLVAGEGGLAHLEVGEGGLALGVLGREQRRAEGDTAELVGPVACVGLDALARRVADGGEPPLGGALGPVVSVVGERDHAAQRDHHRESGDDGDGELALERGQGGGVVAHGTNPALTMPSRSAMSSSSRPLVSGRYRQMIHSVGTHMIIIRLTVSPMLPMAPLEWSPRMPTSAGPNT